GGATQSRAAEDRWTGRPGQRGSPGHRTDRTAIRTRPGAHPAELDRAAEHCTRGDPRRADEAHFVGRIVPPALPILRLDPQTRDEDDVRVLLYTTIACPSIDSIFSNVN